MQRQKKYFRSEIDEDSGMVDRPVEGVIFGSENGKVVMRSVRKNARPRTVAGKYIYNVLYSVDQLGNTLAGGDPDETISSALGKMERDGELRALSRLLVRALDRIDPNHCADAIEHDEGARSLRRRGRGKKNAS